MRSKLRWKDPLTDFELLIIAVFVLLIFAVPGYEPEPWHKTGSAKDACLNNLRLIESAKRKWAFANQKSRGDTPTIHDLTPYLTNQYGELPWCPNDPTETFATSYAPGTIGARAICGMSRDHVLPSLDWPYRFLTGDILHYAGDTFVAICIGLGAVLIIRCVRTVIQR